MIRISFGAKHVLDLYQHAVGGNFAQEYISNTAADEGTADKRRHIEQPAETFFPPQEGHHRIRHDCTDDASTDDLTKDCKDNSTFGQAVKHTRQESTKNRSGQGNRRDTHGQHTDNADQRGAKQ